jgi:signal transduction histidine kinase
LPAIKSYNQHPCISQSFEKKTLFLKLSLHPTTMVKYFFIKMTPVVGMLLFSLFSFCQTQKITALKIHFYKASNNQQQFNALIELCDEGRSMNIDTFYHYATLARQTAYNTTDKNNTILADIAMEEWLERKDFLDSALKICDDDLAKIKYVSAGDAYAKQSMQKCYILTKSNRHKEALDQAYHFLNEAEIKEDIVSQVYCENIIATVFRNMQQREQALQWSLKAANTGSDTIYQERKNAFGVYFIIGLMYNWRVNADVLAKDISSDSILSVSYLDKGIAYSRQYENLPMLARNLCTKASGIEDPKQFTLAGKYINEAIDIYNTLGDTISIINGIVAMCDYYINIGQPQKGVEACLKAIGLAKRGHAFPLPDLYSKLGDCYKAAGDHEKYEETLNEVITLDDEAYKKNSATDLAYLNAKYEDQKKANIIIQQKYDLTKRNYLFYGTLILLIVTLILGNVFLQNRKKNQQLKMQQLVFEQKKNTTAAVMQAGEDERKRIAEDLHDSVAQKMVVAKLNLEAFEGYLPELNEEQQRVFNNIFSLVDESCTEVRSLSHSMMPHAFFKSGLTDAVKDFIDKIDTKHLQISFNAEGGLSVIDKNKEIMIYRIIQECIQNVLKHAKADKLDIAIIAGDKEIDVTIEDNGIGFNPKTIADTESTGMKNIQSRINFLNGKLDIDSQPGMGTVIAFYIPIV